jgi:multidrug transporter EmrE-like cation transporter
VSYDLYFYEIFYDLYFYEIFYIIYYVLYKMKYSHSYFFLIMLIVVFENFAQYNIKKNKIEKNMFYIFLAIASYAMVCLLLGKCYDFAGAGVGMTNFIWSILSIVSLIILGIIAFHETITKYDIIGILLCICGLYFIFIVDHI